MHLNLQNRKLSNGVALLIEIAHVDLKGANV